MDWVKKHYDLTILGLATLLLTLSAAWIGWTAYTPREEIAGISPRPAQIDKYDGPDLSVIQKGLAASREPARWLPASVGEKQGSLFVSRQYLVIGGKILDPVDDGVDLHPPITNAWLNNYKLDYTDIKIKEKDSDADGFTNLEEFLTGTNPIDPSNKPSSYKKVAYVDSKPLYKIVFTGIASGNEYYADCEGDFKKYLDSYYRAWREESFKKMQSLYEKKYPLSENDFKTWRNEKKIMQDYYAKHLAGNDDNPSEWKNFESKYNTKSVKSSQLKDYKDSIYINSLKEKFFKNEGSYESYLEFVSANKPKLEKKFSQDTDFSFSFLITNTTDDSNWRLVLKKNQPLSFENDENEEFVKEHHRVYKNEAYNQLKKENPKSSDAQLLELLKSNPIYANSDNYLQSRKQTLLNMFPYIIDNYSVEPNNGAVSIDKITIRNKDSKKSLELHKDKPMDDTRIIGEFINNMSQEKIRFSMIENDTFFLTTDKVIKNDPNNAEFKVQKLDKESVQIQNLADPKNIFIIKKSN